MNQPPLPVEGSTLTKPGTHLPYAAPPTLTLAADWAMHMVVAALKCALDSKTTTTHASPDEAKHSILRSLNWLEAHGEYEWPDFSRQKFDFAQAMRMRRALVQDVCDALVRAGSIGIGVLGTQERRVERVGVGAASIGVEGADVGQDGGQVNQRKRVCKREGDVEDDAASERSESHDRDGFLVEVMTVLAARANVDMAEHMHKERDAHTVANLLHDSLVVVWDGPQSDVSEQHAMLQQKADVWETHRRSHPPRSTQRKWTTMPRVWPPHQASGPVQKAAVGASRQS